MLKGWKIGFVVVLVCLLSGGLAGYTFAQSASSNLTLGAGQLIMTNADGSAILVKADDYNGDYYLLLQAQEEGVYTKLMLSPIGGGAPSPGGGNWTSMLQLANTDITDDFENYEIAEITWEGNYFYINVFKNGTGIQRTLSFMLDAKAILKLDVGNATIPYGDEGEFFVWQSRPTYFTKGGTWASPLNLVSLGTGTGSASSPLAENICSAIFKIPSGTVLSQGENEYAFYAEATWDNAYAVAFSEFENLYDRFNVTVNTLVRSWDWDTENKLIVDVWSNQAYTTVGNIYIVVELRY